MSRRLPLSYLCLWLVLVLLASGVEIGASRARHEESFQTDARIMHRLLSQRAAQHEAILTMLSLFQPAGPVVAGSEAQRLSALYPQILRVESPSSAAWGPNFPTALAVAEDESRLRRRPVLASVDARAGHFWVVLAAWPASHALEIDARTMVPWEEWPLPQQGAPVRVTLEHGGHEIVLSKGAAVADGGWLDQHLHFSKTIAAESQPFSVVVSRQYGWHSQPWFRLAAWWLGCAILCGLLAWLQGQRQARRRAEDLLRFGQMARLNTLGELAAGLAHELNQPLAAVSANTQAASRLLNEDPPEIETARGAMLQAVGQSRRAAEVLARLRRAIERPGLDARLEAVNLHSAAKKVLALLQGEIRCSGLEPVLTGEATLLVQADPVALEQIIHNLLMNALQAMDSTPSAAHSLSLRIEAGEGVATLCIKDGGPGISPEAMPRLFEPFFSTKEGGLGLGLSLCETLVTSMGGRIRAANCTEGGAEFCLTLPLALPETVR